MKILRVLVLKTPVLIVGNLTVGGTGKTSLSIKLYEILKKNYKIVFIKKKYSNQLDERNLLNSLIVEFK